MTIKDYISKLEKKQKELISLSEKALFNASIATRDAMAKRIFNEGENIAGQTHQYSRKPITISGYKIRVPKKVSPNSKVYRFIGIQSKKKVGRGEFYGRYFPNGYYEYKKFIGQNNAFVNFKLTGGLQMAFNNGLKKVNKNQYEIRLTNSRATELRRALDLKYGGVFMLSPYEREYFVEIYQKDVFYLNEIYD